ncbi:ABC transporter ATP-binding protein [Caldovatus sediminis]|uniref:ABC transporter ATP-binding protein n=1 Tax=Caldovatus sediminis TaxID=2041189 RepID=A0A8J3EAG1_9PROT|nr:ABC transporter ATP-binding protein [Caldovatus sediminis]GGG26797.1 ABC transporter ATP-binding protein [Caldovatus sediminis]
MATLLEARALTAGYGGPPVLHGVALAVEEGGVTALLGANGAGKTTILRALCGMIAASGEVRFAGERIDGLPTEAIARRGIAHVPDGRGTFAELTVEENLRLGAITRRDRAAVAADLEGALTLFPRLRERWRQQAGTLSGGEQQMLAIARALLLRPRLLLLDEPSFGLAPLAVREVFGALARLRAEAGVAMLLVEQNAALALDLADRACLLETGRVVLQGEAAALRRDAAVRRAYLGR